MSLSHHIIHDVVKRMACDVPLPLTHGRRTCTCSKAEGFRHRVSSHIDDDVS